MRGRIIKSETTRAELSEAIIEVLASWPSLYRYVFTQAHYSGRSADHISQGLGMELPEVHRILEHCESDLKDALRAFRHIDADGSDQTAHSEPGVLEMTTR